MLQKLFRQTAVYIFSNSFSKAFLLIFEFGVAYFFGAADYGLFSIAFAIFLVLSNLALMGINFGVVQYLAAFQEEAGDHPKITALIQGVLVFVSIVGLLFGLLLIQISPWLAQVVFGKMELTHLLVLVGLVLPFEVINRCLSGVFQGLRRYADSVLVGDLIRNLALLTSLPALFFFDLNQAYLLYFLVVGTVLGTGLGLYKTGREYTIFSRPQVEILPILKQVISFSYLLFFWQILQILSNNSQTMLGGVFLSSREVGILTLFLKFVFIFTFFQTAVNRTIIVEFARLTYHRDQTTQRYLFVSVSRVLLVICTLIALPLLVRPDLLLGLFGAEYVPDAWWLLPIIVAQIINVGSGPIGQLLIANEKQKVILLLTILSAATQICLSVILMPKWGLAGAVLAWSIATLVITLVRQWFSMKQLQIHYLTGEFGLLFGLGLLGFGTGLYFNILTNFNDSMLMWSISASLALGTYLLLLAPYAYFNLELQSQLRRIWKRVALILP